MTNTPGDDQSQPKEPGGESTPPPPPGPEQEQPGYWEQQAQGQQPPYQAYPQQPYQQPGYPPQAPAQYAPDHPRATTVLVLGILSLVLCQVLGPFAWVMGKRTLREIDASGGALGGRGAANAGYVLGIVATVLLGLAVVGLLIALAVLIVTGVSTTTVR